MRIDQSLDPFRPAHPGLGTDRLHPVSKTRDEAEVLLHMLLADPAGRDDAPGREGEGLPEDRLGMKMPSAWWRSARCRKSAVISLLWSNQACTGMKSSTVPPHFFTEERAW